MEETENFGERLADKITAVMGSWKFIIIQGAVTFLWIALNVLGLSHHWDHYPFVLLNLVYSFQAGFTGPILLLSNNRQAAKDRANLENDLAVWCRAAVVGCQPGRRRHPQSILRNRTSHYPLSPASLGLYFF